MRNLTRGSIAVILTGLLAAFGLFWLGIALHRALLPEVGMAWSWAIAGALYVLLALGAAMAALRMGARSAERLKSEFATAPLAISAGQLGLELAREVEREVRHHPVRAVSLAMLGGAVLGASPELRRGLVGAFRMLNGREAD